MTDALKKVVVAMLDKAEGNESIGTAWVETAIFDADAPLAQVLEWAEGETKTFDGKPRGKLVLRYAEDHRARSLVGRADHEA